AVRAPVPARRRAVRRVRRPLSRRLQRASAERDRHGARTRTDLPGDRRRLDTDRSLPGLGRPAAGGRPRRLAGGLRGRDARLRRPVLHAGAATRRRRQPGRVHRDPAARRQLRRQRRSALQRTLGLHEPRRDAGLRRRRASTRHRRREDVSRPVVRPALTMARASRAPRPPRRVLSIHAHPDDQEFTVAGTLAAWARAGAQIVTVCLTRGDAGSNQFTPADMTRPRLAKIREEEQRAAARVLGINDVVFLDYEDGVLTASIDMRRDLTRLIRRYTPDTVVCGDPTM